jgi:uncharacterized Zn finger protein (UPF0148 family)
MEKCKICGTPLIEIYWWGMQICPNCSKSKEKTEGK